MAKLTMDEFMAAHPGETYAARCAGRHGVVDAWMVRFEDPGFLAGPFGGSFGLVTVSDHRKGFGPTPLRAQTEEYNSWRAYCANNLSNLPGRFAAAAGVSKDHEYLSGRYRKDTLEPLSVDHPAEDTIYFGTRNTLENSATLDHPFLRVAGSSDTRIDCLDMLRIVREMAREMDPVTLVAALDGIEAEIVRQTTQYHEQDAIFQPTLEKPYRLSLMGNDDASWGKVFADLEDARTFAAELELVATREFVWNHMGFTN